MIIAICIGISFAAECKVDESLQVKKVGAKYVSVEEYWAIRSHALGELIPFLTSTRIEAKRHYKILTDYLGTIGKGEDYLKTDVKGSNSPAEYIKLIGKADEFEKTISNCQKSIWNGINL